MLADHTTLALQKASVILRWLIPPRHAHASMSVVGAGPTKTRAGITKLPNVGTRQLMVAADLQVRDSTVATLSQADPLSQSLPQMHPLDQ